MLTILTFLQTVLVEVGQISDDSDIQFIKDSILKTVDPWDSSNSDIVSFEPLPPQKVHRNDADLLSKYAAPQPSKFKISPVLAQSNLTRENYKERMHQLLSIEEMSQYQVDDKYKEHHLCTLRTYFFCIILRATSLSG